MQLNKTTKIKYAFVFVWLFVTSTSIADIIDDVNQLDLPKKKKTGELPTQLEPPVRSTQDTNSSDLETNSNVKDNSKSDKKSKVSENKSSIKSSENKISRRNLPIHLQSEGTSTYSQNGALVNLQKNVVITQDDVRLQADEARVQLAKGKESSSVEVVEMLGRVNLNRYSNDPTQRITAKGDKAIFNNSDQIVTLEGNARLWRDGHLIRGDKIIYEILSGMVKVDRVQGVVQPEKARVNP